MMSRVRALLVVAILAGALAACTEQEPAERKAGPAPAVPLESLPTRDDVVAEVEAAVAEPGKPEDGGLPLEMVTRYGTLDATEQSCHASYQVVVREPICLLGDPEGKDDVVLWGDTHASQWLPAFREATGQTGRRLRVHVKYGCPPLLGLTPWLEAENRPYDECVQFNDAALAEIRLAEPKVVVVAGAVRGPGFAVDGQRVATGTPGPKNSWQPAPEATGLWQEGLGRTLDALTETGARVVVLGDSAYPGIDPGTCLPAHPRKPGRCAVPRRRAVHDEVGEAVAEAAEEHGAEHVATVPLLCGEQDCPPVVDGRVVYRDGVHVGRSYAAHLARALAQETGLLDD